MRMEENNTISANVLAAMLWGGAALLVPWVFLGTPRRGVSGGVPGGGWFAVLCTLALPWVANRIHRARPVGCAVVACLVASWGAFFYQAFTNCC